ncbi:hypothetical protein AK812_SmicGene46250, partial [Symbiodinium microadriaticum]
MATACTCPLHGTGGGHRIFDKKVRNESLRSKKSDRRRSFQGPTREEEEVLRSLWDRYAMPHK